MAEAALLDWFVSPLISKLVQKGFSIFEDGMKGKLENLHTMVPQIKQVIEKAEMLGREDDKQLMMMVWLRELQDAAYEADNVLDEYDYELLKRQSAKGKFVKAIARPPLSFLSNASFRSKLRDCLEKLDKIASRVHTFTNMLGGGMSITASSSLADDETTFVTGSEPTEPQIFGRDAVRDRILDLLLINNIHVDMASESTDDHLQMDVPVLPIVGVGGVGKTTLAQDIYNNPKIIARFPKRMWIHTPKIFDEIMITKRMVESVRQDACPAINNFATLQQSLQEGLQKKRFLLVLDDVWYDEKQSEFVNRERWRKLLAPLRHTAQGSVVLITSRIDLVAMTLGGNAMQTIRLEGLNEHDCSSLFNRYAFEAADAACGQQRPDDDQNIDRHLMEIGREIARKIVSKLGGLPLAAKVLGGMLRNKHDVEEWNKVLRTDIWDDITRVLALSYKRLPPLLRQCVAHHGLYPKGLSFNGNYLIRAWIAEGFISAAQHDERQESGRKSMEEIGSNCLNELVFRSFLQRTHDGLFLLHDLMHDVADSVSRHECTRIQKGEKKKAIPPTTKHLCIHVEDLNKYKEYICRLKNLRSLFLVCDQFTLDHGVLHSILNKSKRLRTLDLAALRLDKLPDSIGDLKHLRFLDLSYSTVKTIYDCGFLDNYMGRCLMGLTRLSELQLSQCQNMTSLPTAEELMHLTSLHGLRIEECDQLVSVGGLHVLLSSLQILGIFKCPRLFSHKSASDVVATDIPDVDDALSPPDGFSRDLIVAVDNLSLLPLILLSRKGLESLTALALYGSSQNTAFTREQEEWFQHLPSLQSLMIHDCERLPSLPSNLTSLTRLKELNIQDCPQVSSLPTLPMCLEALEIEGCHPELEQRCREGTGPDWDLIKHIPHIEFI